MKIPYLTRPYKEQAQKFSARVPVYVKWTRIEGASSYPLHHHPEYEIHFIRRGKGAYYIQGRRWHFKTNYLIVIKPDQIHGFIPDAKSWLERGMLQFSKTYVNKNILRALETGGNLPVLIPLSDSAAVHFEIILNRMLEENSRREAGWEEMIRELLHEHLLLVKRAKKYSAKPVKENPLFAQLRQYIETHCFDPQCSVMWIAEKFGYSLNYLSALFHKVSGRGIKQYLLQYRIAAARRIIENNCGIKIESVAREVGFSCYRSFSRSFSALTGISPASYREHCRPYHKK